MRVPRLGVTIGALLLLLAAAALLAACETAEVEELLQSPVPSGSPSPDAALTETPTPTPSEPATLTPSPEPAGPKDPCPEGIHPQLTMYLAGPAQAKPGQEVTYTLFYNLVDRPEAVIRVEWDPGVAYVGAERISGIGSAEPLRVFVSDMAVGQSEWLVGKGEGTLDFTLLLPQGAAFDDILVFAYVTGVCAPKSDNALITTIVRG